MNLIIILILLLPFVYSLNRTHGIEPSESDQPYLDEYPYFKDDVGTKTPTQTPTIFPTPFGEYDSGGEADPTDAEFINGPVIDEEIGTVICSKRGLVFNQNCFCDWYKYPVPSETDMVRHRYTPKCSTTARPTTSPTNSPTLDPFEQIIQSCVSMTEQTKKYANLIDDVYYNTCGRPRRCGKCVRNVHKKLLEDTITP